MDASACSVALVILCVRCLYLPDSQVELSIRLHGDSSKPLWIMKDDNVIVILVRYVRDCDDIQESWGLGKGFNIPSLQDRYGIGGGIFQL